MSESTDTVALYVHVPFCQSLCPYCAFYKKPWSSDEEIHYLNAIKIELDHYKNNFAPITLHSIFLGGGTPSILSTNTLETLLTYIHQTFQRTDHCESTSEMNPESVTQDKLTILKNFGFNRISIGVQSFQTSELQFLGRTHSQNKVVEAIQLLHKNNLKNFNIDLIFGLKNATLPLLKNTLDRAIALEPTHLSTYALSIEDGTPFEREHVSPMDDDHQLTHYRYIRNYLKKNGYAQYEVSAFSKPEFQSQHNLTYWTLNPYIGIGPSASSFYLNQHYQHPKNLTTYCKNPTTPIPRKSIPNTPELIQDYISTHLRLMKGLFLPSFQARFNTNFEAEFAIPISKLTHLKLLKKQGNYLRVTTKGLYLLNSVLLEFMS
ncbi:MAG: radical SAM family heme chaperone HemW [Candidatus Margulisbacteria bacterium]|nr:radical SAM family heme chaperone HemW [Candidatus Margulisiibacteriota bacterium]